MKKRNPSGTKESFAISKQKQYQRKIKHPQVEQQTLLKEDKKPIYKINKQWHLEHPMPQKASLKQRIAWHKEHAKHCNCHPMPTEIQQAIDAQKD